MSDYASIEVGELTRGFTLVARADGSPIVGGTVNWYLLARSGANAGKWYRNSDSTWQVAETANAMTHEADGHWTLTLSASPFASGIKYREYAKEGGNLHVPVGLNLHSEYTPSANSSRNGAADVQTIKTQTVTAAAGVTFPTSIGTSTYAGADTAGTTTLLTRITGAVLLAAGYTAPDNAGITAIKAKTDNLPTDPADASDIAAAFGAVTSALTTLASAVGAVPAAVWAVLTSALTATGTIGKAMATLAGGSFPTVDAIDAQLSGTHGSGAWGANSGTGDTAVDHNAGGADNLRLTVNDAGVDGADARAYLAADWTAGRYGRAYIKGQTTTGPVGGESGRMLAPMYLQSGNAYTIAWNKAGYLETTTKDLTI